LHRSSFAPTTGNKLKWFIDGKDYFHALSEALEQATSTIAIIGWWVTPELFLRRPPGANHDWRLDRMYLPPQTID
jgi:phospholipase D1/2